jgi:microcystin-dependent protein
MSSPYVGEIRMVGFNFAPTGWAFCDGTVMAISQNEVLFNLIGTTYGGDGVATFALPNLLGRMPVHQGNSFTLAQAGGEEAVVLTSAQLPTHTHVPGAVTAKGNQPGPSKAVWAATSGGANLYATASGAAPLSAGAIADVGGNQPHSNMSPFLALSFIIALFGVFPSQS